MADASGKDGVATELIQEAELTESPENVAADARGSAADSTISGNATEDAFFAMLEEETMTDANLRHSVVEFLCEWRQRRLASYQELLAESAVEREMSVCLPKAVPMWRWISRRLAGDMYMTVEETGKWTIHVVGGSGLSRSISKWYQIQASAVQSPIS